MTPAETVALELKIAGLSPRAVSVIRELAQRLETLELATAALLPPVEEMDPLEASHQAFVAGPVSEARARERNA